MKDVVREPVELIDEDLDEVAGGRLTVNVGIGAVFGGRDNNNVGVGQNSGGVNFDNFLI